MKIGQQVAHYKILEKLGEGGMGVVYKAEDTVLSRTVALKFLQHEIMASEESRSRLIREARAASTLDHPNICTIHQVEKTDDGRFFICMGYCEGDTLRKKLKEPEFGIAEKIDTAIQIAEGLAHAHAHGIVHRDMKPENVIIGADGRARIMDFGLAKLAGQPTILKTGTVAGTLFYMSPEQLKGAELDQRSDIWSLGAILYELLTGKTPFAGEYEAAVSYSIANEPVVPPSRIRSELPTGLERVVMKALEKKPEDRYPSMKDMIGDLRAVRQPVVDGVTESSTTAGRRLSSRKARRRTVYAALVGIAVGAAALVTTNMVSTEDAPVTVAVLDFENSAGEEGFDKILASLLTTDLAQTPMVRVLGRERMRELQEELNIETLDESAGFELARRAGVQMLISGKVMRMGGSLRVDASVYDVETKNLLFAKHEEGEGPDSVFDMIDDLSRSIRKDIRVLPKWEVRGEPSLAALTTESVEAYRLFSLGEDIRDSKPEEAAMFMEQAVARDPAFAVAYMELALLYNHQLGDGDKALECALKAKELSKDKSPKEYLKSLIYESWVLMNWDSVIEYMTRYLELQPNDMRVQRRLGWVLAQRESTYDEAILHFNKMIGMDPRNISGEISSAYNHLGNVKMHMGDFEGAIAAFERYRDLCPGRPAPLHSIGNAYLISGRYKDAVGRYLEILEGHPGFYISYESLGMAYLAMGKWREALNAFRRYLAAAPAGFVSNAHVRMAEVYCAQEDFILAQKEIEEAVSEDPESIYACWRMGLIALASKGSAGAQAELDAIEELLKNPASAAGEACRYHLRGRLELAQGQTAEGLLDLRRAVEAAPRDQFHFFSRELVKGYIDAGHAEDALREGAALLARNPNDGELLNLLGCACERKGDRAAMVEYLSRALETWGEADRDFAPLMAARDKL